MPTILFKAHFKKLMQYTGLTFTGFAFIIFLIQLVEVIRRGHGKKISFMMEAKMALLLLPTTLELIMPICILVASLWTFWRLHTNKEFIILKATGVTFYKFLTPFITGVLTLGILKLLLLNPFAAYTKTLYETYSSKAFKDGSSINFNVDGKGAWMRFFDSEGYILIRAHQIVIDPLKLKHTTHMFFNKEGVLQKTIFAEEATFDQKNLIFKNGFETDKNGMINPFESHTQRTRLEASNIEKAMRPQNHLSIHALRTTIEQSKKAGFQFAQYNIQLWNHYLSPLMMATMLLFSSVILFSNTRKALSIFYFLGSISAGLFLYLLNAYMMGLGSYGYLPVAAALLAPMVIALSIWLAFILHMEHAS